VVAAVTVLVQGTVGKQPDGIEVMTGAGGVVIAGTGITGVTVGAAPAIAMACALALAMANWAETVETDAARAKRRAEASILSSDVYGD